jgi:hypothetical protein
MEARYIATLSAACAAFLATGCAVTTQITREEAGPYPENYKEIIASYIKSSFKDPYSLKDVMISKPMPYKILHRAGYVVCLQTNAKNSYGGYVGISHNEIMIEGQKVWGTGNDYCYQRGGLEPWPEMEGKK